MHMWMKYWGGGRFVFDDKVLCTARNPGTMDDFGSTIWIVSMIPSHDDDSEDGRWMKKSPVPFSAALSLTGYYRLILQIHRIPYKKNNYSLSKTVLILIIIPRQSRCRCCERLFTNDATRRDKAQWVATICSVSTSAHNVHEIDFQVQLRVSFLMVAIYYTPGRAQLTYLQRSPIDSQTLDALQNH